MKKVLLFGTFDYIHPGHMYVFREAQKRGEVHIIVARNETVEKIKGHNPHYSEEERKKQLEELLPDAVVLLGDSQNYMNPVQKIKPDLILLGYDQKMPPNIAIEDLPCPIERLEGFKPERYKSTIVRTKG